MLLLLLGLSLPLLQIDDPLLLWYRCQRRAREDLAGVRVVVTGRMFSIVETNMKPCVHFLPEFHNRPALGSGMNIDLTPLTSNHAHSA